MALLPPPDHIPASIAILYLVAKVLHEETKQDREKKDRLFLRNKRLPFARIKIKSSFEIFEMVSTGFPLLPGQQYSSNTITSGGVWLSFDLKRGFELENKQKKRRNCLLPRSYASRNQNIQYHYSLSHPIKHVYQKRALVKSGAKDCGR